MIHSIIRAGHEFRHQFSFTMEEVLKFMEVTGESMPLQTDYSMVSEEQFGKPVLPDYLGSSIFSKVLNSIFPGNGSVYLKQSIAFIRPMFSDTIYEAVFMVKEVSDERRVGIIDTRIVEIESGLTTVKGEAMVGNEEMFSTSEDKAREA